MSDSNGSKNQIYVTINQLASQMQVSTNTLRNWEDVFSIAVPRNNKKARFYPENVVGYFQKIKELVAMTGSIDEAKTLFKSGVGSSKNHWNQTEILSEKETIPEQNFNLIIKPYEERIKKLEEIESKYILTLMENATLQERVKNKDDIINMFAQQKTEFESQKQELKEKLQELEARLNRKWWKFGF